MLVQILLIDVFQKLNVQSKFSSTFGGQYVPTTIIFPLPFYPTNSKLDKQRLVSYSFLFYFTTTNE